MSRNHRYTRSPFARAVTLLTLLAVVFSAAAASAPAPASAAGNIEDLAGHEHEADVDNRAGVLSPTSTQVAAVPAGASVRWNRFGTPQSLIRYGGYLGTASGTTARSAAYNWLSANKALFGLTSLSGLEFVNDSTFRESAKSTVAENAHAVLFRQRFARSSGALLPATQDGMVTIGIVKAGSSWNVAYVSSSFTRSTTLAAEPAITAKAAWLTAARTVAPALAESAIGAATSTRNGWTTFAVTGFAQPQRARLVALPTQSNGVRPAYETIVLDADSDEGHAEAFTVFVDAVTSKVLLRVNRVQQFADAQAAPPTTTAFQGTYTPTRCTTPPHTFTVPSGQKTIAVVASAALPTNDIVLNLRAPNGDTVSSDTLTSPEAVEYAPDGGAPAGVYTVTVCPYTPTSSTPPYNYAGTFTYSDRAVSAFAYPPKWQYYRSNPNANYLTVDTRPVLCWDLVNQNPECYQRYGLANLASRAPWDVDVRANNASTYTTKGNNASTAEAWGSPLTPAEQYRPSDPNREYLDKTFNQTTRTDSNPLDPFSWGNQWYENKCNQASFTAAENRNDIDAAVTSLFANHNRIHDWSYYLGFTERNYNLQESNFGLTDARRENDPEIGNAQAGAVSGGAPSYTGRDNANQITLNDGIPPITNMYLWQPLAAGFYAPCVDGDYDMSVIAHEYGHAIQNRMAAGPDAGLSGHQARAMGESWSDLTAVEYLAEHREYVKYPENQVQGVNGFAVGPYVTGNKQSGIRNYGMNASDLNYSNLEYDPNGVTSPHADGEIWSATNYDIRQALVARYNASFPATDDDLQQACADNDQPVRDCPGNRRWFQILMDAFLLMPSEVTMLDARDAYLAADQMRFGGAHQRELWRAFAKRGMGIGALSPETAAPTSPDATSGAAVENRDPRPSFETPIETNEATITFAVTAQDGLAGATIPNARIYVGRYEARAVPIADTIGGGSTSNRAKFVPGTYTFAVQAPGYGLYRFTRTLTAGQVATLRIAMPTNWASRSKGASAFGDGVNESKLIDDTEATNWARLDAATISGQKVTVNLAGSIARQVRRVQVSALLRPEDPDDPGGDIDPQNRFTALRQFEIYTCNVAAGQNCGLLSSYTRLYTSPSNAFPAGRPRPLAPDMVMKSFDVTDRLATHVQLRVVTNQCTGAPAYQGEQDNDPTNVTDCRSGSTRDNEVRAAEMQVFTGSGAVTTP